MQESQAMADLLSDSDPSAAPAVGAPLAHADALPSGTRLAEFEVQGLLGVGGFGLVYRAYDHSLHRTVALKEYMPTSLASRDKGLALSIRSSTDRATYEAGLRSFVAEARLLAQFDHPSLVKVYRFWEANNTAYMVMPLYRGMTLKQARSLMSAPPPEAWLRTMLWSVLQALQVLHEHHTMHRDVSPDNIFLQDVGPPVLLDLGAARRAISDKSQKLTAILKVNYAPIEQYAETEGLSQGPWTDLYSLAAVIYGCLRNDPPLPATTRVVRDTMPSVQSVAATVEQHFGLHYSEAFLQTLAQALAIQPDGRPQSVPDFVQAMGLQPPPALGKFDWRAELGAPLQRQTDSGGDSDSAGESVWLTQPQTVPVRAATAHTAAHWAAWLPRQALLLAVLAVVLLLLALYGEDWLGDGLPVAAPEPATVPAAVPVPAIEAVAALPPGSAASQPQLPADAAGPAASAPVTAAVAEERKTAAAAAERPASPASAPQRKLPSRQAVSAPKPLCADANFVYRPICLHLECQKPENRNRPVCIETMRRFPDPPPRSP